MELRKAIKARKSIRGYKPDPVPRAVLAEILALSTRAPSAINIQPWEITVVSGEDLDRIKQDNVKMMESGVWPHPDMPTPVLTEVHRRRQLALGSQLYRLLGIHRDDHKKSYEWAAKSMRFFDAPAVILITADEALDMTSTAFDCGLLTENIALLALEYGLGTCINQQGVFYPEVVKTIAGIPASRRIIICISIGYPDWDYPANRIYSEREPLENIAVWRGFEDM